MKIKELENLVGTLSKTSKMPSYSYSLPAEECKTGKKLAKIEGSTCSNCYALKGFYRMPNVKKALYNRLNKLNENPFWEFNMIELIDKKTKNQKKRYFRWHDSGDVQSFSHLRKIAFIAEQLKDVSFWLPTRENATVKKYLSIYGRFPSNLCVRVSSHMVDKNKSNNTFSNKSNVITKEGILPGMTCPATKPDNKPECGNCRSCWDKSIETINYLIH